LKERGLAGIKRTISDIVRQSPTVGDRVNIATAPKRVSQSAKKEEKESRKTEKKRHIRVMAFVSDFACECVKTELDIFAVPPTQTSIQQAEWVEYQPLTNILGSAPIEFGVIGSGEEIYRSVKCHAVRTSKNHQKQQCEPGRRFHRRAHQSSTTQHVQPGRRLAEQHTDK